MTNRLMMLLALMAAGPAPAAEPDLLRFDNGDQLHGRFEGIQEGPRVLWRRDDLMDPVRFKTTELRHIVLHGGRAGKPLASLSYLGLVNGDRFPGRVTGIDAESVTMETVYAGELRIPRDRVSIMAPNPLGGRVYYYGPFVEDEWEMRDASPGEDKAEADEEAAAVKEADEEAAADGDEEARGRWVFAGSAWYWQNPGAGTALVRESGMPDRAVLAFDLAWKNRLSVAIGFHADFAKPGDGGEDAEEGGLRRGRAFTPGDVANLPHLFGNSYVLQLYSNYLMLYRTSVTDEGKGSLERVRLNNNNFRLDEAGRVRVELRCNRRTGMIALFLDGEFVAQWSEGEGEGRAGMEYAGKGSGFGFVVQGDETPVRLSEVVVSEWNGMPDSARSLEADDQDIVLMANGTDRYSGRVGMLDENGLVMFEGRHGSFRFPLDEVAEIRFARNRLAGTEDETADQLRVRLSPVGVISGTPVSGDGRVLGLLSPVAGPLDLSLDYAVMLELNSSSQIIDDWDDAF